jgi:uncharacterized protein (TIGR01777 family)
MPTIAQPAVYNQNCMKIVLTGSSGLIGKALTTALNTAGHQVIPLVRRVPQPTVAIYWDPLSDAMDIAPLTGTDAVIHLAGENLASGRWNAKKKQRMNDSRVKSTALIARNMAMIRPLPKTLICASATGFYGNRGDEILTEASAPGTGFAADLCRQWEQAAAPAEAAGIRVVHVRLGIVLSGDGGALAKMLTPFRLGLGGPLGHGNQYVSWIALEDVIRAVIHLLEHSQIAGAVNLVAPETVTNRQFAKALGRAIHRPTVFPMPAFVLRLALGEIADELLLASTRVVPKRLMDDGFNFLYPDLEAALLYALAWNRSPSSERQS